MKGFGLSVWCMIVVGNRHDGDLTCEVGSQAPACMEASDGAGRHFLDSSY